MKKEQRKIEAENKADEKIDEHHERKNRRRE